MAAVGGAIALLTTLTGSASAADGEFAYARFDDGTSSALVAPADDACLPLDGGAVHAANDTDATAFLYADVSCKQLLALVAVGAAWDAVGPPVQPAQGVRFSSS
ncbi:hypothetical protein J7F03_10140 [Streptomyces sp. ISL-43]|uniref:hypothetical protein n=1 Tax=Streptomyces sp. ISL-43 TaxID=2819183 RepID=UPI001BE681DB|nr:hypothetical protein [Streptomyces sp. ISL-43]MBT2447428.1 hypothetical protein [Streptomyces sp. ISL-43]